MKLFKHVFGAKPNEILDQTIARAALLAAEVEEFAVAIGYYETLLAKTDPHTEWWRWAELKQKHHNAINDYQVLTRRANHARAQVDALIAKATPWQHLEQMHE